MADNISRLTGQRLINELQRNSAISSRLMQLSGTGSRLARTSRGTIDDISSSSGITRRVYSDSNRRPSVARYSTSARRYISSTRRDVNRGRLSYTNAFDTDRNGTVSDRESMNYLIKLRRNNSERGLAELMQFNQKTQQINQHLNEIDVNSDGVISNQETMNTILNKRANQVASTDLDIVNMILENNSRSTELENLIARVDTDPDGQISREEVLAVLTDIRNNNLDPALVDQLTEVLELNPDIDSIIEEFENSIGANYVASQHAEAQVLTVRRGQELQILGANHSDLMPSPLGFLEEFAEIYGDQYLSDDENSPDFYRFGGLTGQIQEALIDSGHTLEDLINGQINQDDMNLIMDTITQYHPNQTDDIEASFAEQHQSVVNYIGQVQHDLADPRVDFALSMPQLFDAIAEHYGDIGFFDEGYTGFTGALQNALQDWGSLDATTMLNGDFLTQISTMLQALPNVEEPSQPLSIEDRLTQFADINGSGEVDMSDALRLASMINNSFAYASESSGRTGDPAGPEATNFNNGVYDFDGDGTTGAEDLRLLAKYISGARGDALFEETGDTVQSYIENILTTDSPISINNGLSVYGNTYNGVFGNEINQAGIDFVANIIQGNPELNYPDGRPFHPSNLELAVGRGLLDVNNDGITDMEDVAILQRYVDGARGEELLSPAPVRRNATEVVQYLDDLVANDPLIFDIDGDGEANGFSDGALIALYLNGQRGRALVPYLDSNSTRTLEEVEARLEELASNGTLDLDGDGIVSNIDGSVMQFYLLGSPASALTPYLDIEAQESQNGVILRAYDSTEPRRNTLGMVNHLANLTGGDINFFDFDGNGIAGIVTDGVLLVEFLKGKRGDDLEAVLTPGAERSIAEIEAQLHSLARSGSLDIDGDGVTSTRDGMIAGIYMSLHGLGFNDEAIKSANFFGPEGLEQAMTNTPFVEYVDDQEFRSPVEISEYLESLAGEDLSFSIFDIDGDGVPSRGADGQLVQKFIEGLRGDELAPYIRSHVNLSISEVENNLHNLARRLDVDGDGVTSNRDARIAYFYLSARQLGRLPEESLVMLDMDRIIQSEIEQGIPFVVYHDDQYRTSSEIYDYLTNLTTEHSELLDFDGNGRFDIRDQSMLTAYLNGEDSVTLDTIRSQTSTNDITTTVQRMQDLIDRGVFDIDGDGLTSNRDVEMFISHADGSNTTNHYSVEEWDRRMADRGVEFRVFDTGARSRKTGQEIIDYVHAIENYFDIDASGDINTTSDFRFIQMYLDGNTDPASYEAIKAESSTLSGQEIMDRARFIVESNIADINNDGVIDEVDQNILSLVRNGVPAELIESLAYPANDSSRLD